MHDISTLAARMTLPDDAINKQTAAALDEFHGAYGRLGDLAIWLAACQGQWPPQPISRPVLVVLGDGSPPTPLVELAGARVRSLPTGELPGDPGDAWARGAELAAAEVDEGADLLLLAASGDPVPATAVAAVLTNSEVAAMVGHRPGMTDREWMRVCADVRDTARRARPFAGKLAQMLDVLASPQLALGTGLVTEAAARRVGVVLDDVEATAAGLIAQRVSYRAARWFCSAHRNEDPALGAALDRLRLTPVLDYGLSGVDGRTGVGALLALGQLRGAAAVFAAAD